MMEEYLANYREVIPDQTLSQPCKDIVLNTGASQSTLQDIKVAEKAGGYCYKDVSKTHNRNRFIYWRTNHDILELSEISLDINLTDNNIRYKFADSPVLSVAIFENQNFVVILVATVNSIHRLSFSHPDKLQKTYASGSMQGYSIFHEASANTTRDPSTFYVIGHMFSNCPIPHAASAWLLPSGQEAVFSLAYQSTLMLFTINCLNGQTTSQELKQHYIVPRMLSNLTGALRGKSNSADSEYVTSLVFSDLGGQAFVYALYRDDHIRMWPAKTGQCVATVNCLQDGVESRTQGPQSNLLRRASSTMICAFLCHSMGSEFVTIQTHWDGGSNYSLVRTHFIPAPQYDLVDFEINDYRIWGLWCNSQGEFNVSSYSFTPNVTWIPAILESPPDRYSVTVEHGMDPRQTYCSYIFHPGKFQRNVIAKALVMFRRANVPSDFNLPMSYLKDRVCQAVEAEIQNEIKDFEITDEEYIDISSKFWERFYSCCEQYNVKACQPIGLVIMESVEGVCIVKKSAFSLLRPCETLEHLMLAGDTVDVDQICANSINWSDTNEPKSYKGMAQLVNILAMLDQHTLEDINIDFDNKLYQLQIPNAVASQIAFDMLSMEYDETTLHRNFLVKLRQQIKSIPDLVNSMIMLLEILRMDQGDPEAMQTNSNPVQNSRILQSIGYLFGSDIGISLVAESLRQIAQIRYSLCRSLLILQHLLIHAFDLPCNVLEMVRSRCMPETVVFVQAYYVMVWISVTPAQRSVSSSSLENSIQRLSMMQLSDMPPYKRPLQPVTLLELFLRGKGSQTGLTLLIESQYRNLADPKWQYTLLPLVTIVAQLVWAVSGNFVFGEWLLGNCQHVLIQEYVRLLNSWCEWNNCSRYFIAAVSLLDNGETHKAFDYFMEAGKGVVVEPFLERVILQGTDVMQQDEAMIQYYLKVIQLFEQHSALDYVIELAKTAIGILDKNDPQLAMFQSIVFTNHLKLEHYTEAYHALTDNAESSQRKDCLRKLVVCLFEEKRLDLLMQFPYIRLCDDLIDIVESRARSMAIEGNNYYNFLYSFHVTKGNMRKASTIMYEQAMRFSLECETASAIQSRYESLLTCLNALNLVSKEDAWIAKPVINEEVNPIEDMDSDEVSMNQQITVLEIKDIKEEILLTEAVLCLAKHRQEMSSILNADADQLIAVLSNTGLYTAAIKLALGLKKPITSILENLASACIRANDENTNEPWAWLQENDLADLPHRNSAVEMAWKLLERLINENEKENSTNLRKNVATKILSLGEFLPHWLYLSYRKSNPSELLRLYVNHGRLLEATQLATEYISAMMRSGGEYFGLSNSLNVAQPALCFPINTIDLLLYGLEINSKSGNEYQQCFNELRHIVDRYIETAKRVSNDKIQCAAVNAY